MTPEQRTMRVSKKTLSAATGPGQSLLLLLVIVTGETWVRATNRGSITPLQCVPHSISHSMRVAMVVFPPYQS
jgi:hypothetical protein